MLSPTAPRQPRFKKHPLTLAIHFACGALIGVLPLAHAAPTGGEVVGGTGTISQSGTSTTINQATQNLAINWQTFDVAVNERVQFIQPNSTSIALNRILSNNGSIIAGRIDANGQVILANANGIFFTSTAVLNVGSIIASGLDISPTDFMNNQYVFNEIAGTSGAVVNSGLINASLGGNVALVGKQVKNDGLIVANLGTVTLAAGKQAVLTFDNGGLLGVRISQEILQTELGLDPAVLNSGEIQAQGGSVLLTASQSQDVFSRAVNTSGLEPATSVVLNDDGSFTLGNGADVLNSGSINVSTTSADQGTGRIVLIGENVTSSGTLKADTQSGNGGEIELHAKATTLLTQNSITSARSESNGSGGIVKVLGDKVGLFDQSTVDVSGANGGGRALIGGDFQGKNNQIRNASKTIVAPGSTIYADALNQGNGGKVIVWADDYTRFYGNIFARGGSAGGNGGFAEVSGKEAMVFEGHANLTAAHGDMGTLLLDPKNITICAAGTTGCTTPLNFSGNGDSYNSFSEAASTTTTLRNTDLANQLTDSAVDLRANNDIVVAADVISAQTTSGSSLLDNNLNLEAGRSIIINDNVTIALDYDAQNDRGHFSATINHRNAQSGDRDPDNAVFSMGTGSRIETRGGNIDISTDAHDNRIGDINLQTLSSSGQVGSPGNAGSNAGAITVTNAYGDIAVNGPIEARGGDGASSATPGGNGGNGGDGGNIALTATRGSITIGGAILANGGVGAAGRDGDLINGTPGGTGGNGGNAGTIGLTVGTNLVVAANLEATGGAAGTGGAGGPPGNAGISGNANTITLQGDNTANTFTINNDIVLAGSPAGINVYGLGGNDRLERGGTTDTTWTITADNTGTLQYSGRTINFYDVETLVGNGAQDTFILNAAGSLSGLLDGGSGVVSDTLTFSTSNTTLQLGNRTDAVAVADPNLNVTGIESITATVGSTGNTLIGDNVATTWRITGVNAGLIAPAGANTTSFQNIGTLTGGEAADTFYVSGGTIGALNGGGGTGNNSLAFNGTAGDDGIALSANTLTLNSSSGAASLLNYSNINDVTINAQTGLDTIALYSANLTGTVHLTAETVTGNSLTAGALILDNVGQFGTSTALIDTNIASLALVNSSPLVYLNELNGLDVTIGPGGVNSDSIFRVGGIANIDAGGGNLVLDNAGNDFDTVNIGNAASIVMHDRDAIDGGSMTAASITLAAVNGIGTSANPLITNTARLSVTNTDAINTGVNITNTGAATVSITNLGDIELTNNGNLIIERLHAYNGTYPVPLNSTGPYPGDVRLIVNGGSISAYTATPAYSDLTTHTAAAAPDIIAQNLNVRVLGGEFGTRARPMSLRVQDTFTYFGGRGYWQPFGADPRVFDDVNNSLVRFSSLGNLNLQLLEVESLEEFDPAIFTEIRNYYHEDVAILLPSDQRLDGADEDEDEDEDEKEEARGGKL